MKIDDPGRAALQLAIDCIDDVEDHPVPASTALLLVELADTALWAGPVLRSAASMITKGLYEVAQAQLQAAFDRGPVVVPPAPDSVPARLERLLRTDLQNPGA